MACFGHGAIADLLTKLGQTQREGMVQIHSLLVSL
jgi:hypothetical protein